MSNKTKPVYTKLTLGGYQTFAETVDLPLAKLTFLFGPNSAGKSAIFDGFKLLSTLVTQAPLEPFKNYFLHEKHFRKLSDNPRKYSPLLNIGLSVNVTSEKLRSKKINCAPNNEKQLNRYIGKNKTHNIEYRSEFKTFDRPWPCTGVTETRQSIVCIKLNNSELLRIEVQKRSGINTKHPLVKAMGIFQPIKNIPKRIKNKAFLENDWLWITNHDDDESEATQQVLAEFPDFQLTIEKLLSLLHLLHIEQDIVSASRSIPTPSDLLFFSDGVDTESFEFTMANFPLPKLGDENYQPLADSLVYKFTTGLSSDPGRYDERATAYLSESVNRALSNHLFANNGYQLAADYRLLLSAREYSRLDNLESTLTPGDYPLLIRVYLVDPQGREFSFSDVGSGLGYMLPVLVSLYNIRGISFLQQPELHLHPALQAKMGDVIVEACNLGKQVIVETHSEHLLLRVLKRIRQTASGHPIPDELRLTPEDISVLYFDPGADGATKVKHLRVNQDGDFLDPWPHGFFAERDQELFDE